MSRGDQDLPTGWASSCLEAVCTKITDGVHKTPEYQASGIRFISIKNVRPFKPINWTAYERFVTPTAHAEYTRRCNPEPDDVVFPRIGTLGFAKRIDFAQPVSLFVGLGLLKPRRDVIDPRYLEYFMNCPLIAHLSREKATGSGRLTLALEETRRLPILLAPLSEQRRIAEALDSLFTRLDDAETTLERVKRNLERYRASVLQAAVEGRLVPTESELARRTGRTASKASSLLGLSEKGPHSVAVPEGWCWATVGQVQGSMKNGIYKSVEHYADEGTACLRMYNIEQGEIVWKNIKRMRLPSAEIAEYRLLPGDLLVNRVNSRELVGKAAVFPEGVEDCVFESKNIRLRIRPGVVHPRYLSYTFEVYGREYFNRNAQQVVGMASISQPQVAGLRFQLPPMPEQLRIVRAVDSCLTVGTKVAGETGDTVRRLQALRQSILRTAFTGRLVDQDPTDEPASALLDRVRAERAKASSTKTSQRRSRPRKAVKM